MSDQITVEQAHSRIVAEEYANQNATLIQRLAAERVRSLQLEQQVQNLQSEAALLRPLEGPSLADDEGDSPTPE